MPHHILVADDDPHIREVICFALEKAGMKTLGVADGAAALQEIGRRAPDLVVLDIGMGHCLGRLDGKAEVLRHGACPAFIGLAAMRLVEGRVDLDDRKVPGVAFEMRPGLREVFLVSGWNSPAGRANETSLLFHAWDVDQMRRGSRRGCNPLLTQPPIFHP